MTVTAISLIQKLEDDVWEVIKASDVYNSNLHAVKERLAQIREKVQSEQSKIKAVKDLVAQWFESPSEESLLTDTASAYVVLGTIKELLEEQSSEEQETRI